MLEAHDLVKEFRVAGREPGLCSGLGAFFRPRVQVVRAVDGVGFTLGPGEIVGLLGPNGAGKSTIIKILTGVLEPTAGRVSFEGRTPQSDRRWFTRRIGAVFGQRTQLWWELPVGDSLAVAKAIYQIPDDVFRRSREELVQELGLGPLLAVPVRQLSLGQKMRAELCVALLHRPRVLFLDEPTLGLDLEARDAFHRVIHGANRRWRTSVVLTTHDVADVDALCRRIVIVCAGRIAYEGSVTAAKSRVVRRETRVCTVRTPLGEPPIGTPPPGLDIAVDGDRITLTIDRSRISRDCALAWLAQRCEILQHAAVEVSTADLLLEVYRAARKEAA